MTRPDRTAELGFTLVELLIAMVVMAILVVMAAPSFTSIIERQRLRGVSDQLTTDLQFLRSEAVSRQERTAISFASDATMTCYVIHTCGTFAPDDCLCDCRGSTTAARCGTNNQKREIKLFQLPRSSKVEVKSVAVSGAALTADHVSINPTTGGMDISYPIPLTPIPTPTVTEFWAEAALSSTASTAGAVQTRVNQMGRSSVCSPGGVTSGVQSCP